MLKREIIHHTKLILYIYIYIYMYTCYTYITMFHLLAKESVHIMAWKYGMYFTRSLLRYSTGNPVKQKIYYYLIWRSYEMIRSKQTGQKTLNFVPIRMCMSIYIYIYFLILDLHKIVAIICENYKSMHDTTSL